MALIQANFQPSVPEYPLELITGASKRTVPKAENLLDVGRGAGNYSLMVLLKIPDLHCTLVDLSKPSFGKAFERVSKQAKNKFRLFTRRYQRSSTH